MNAVPNSIALGKFAPELVNGDKAMIKKVEYPEQVFDTPPIQKQAVKIGYKERFIINLMNMELCTADFIIVGRYETLIPKLVAEAEKAGLLKGFSKVKGQIVRMQKIVRHLQMSCSISENDSIMSILCMPLTSMQRAYMNEGGTYLQSVQYQWNQFADNLFTQLYYAIRNMLMAAKVEDKYLDFLCVVWQIRQLSFVHNILHERAVERVTREVGARPKSYTPKDFIDIDDYVNSIIDNVSARCDDVKEHYKMSVAQGSTNILDAFSNKQGGSIIDGCLRTTTNDYINYYIANLILDIRNKKGTTDLQKDELSRIPLTPNQVHKLLCECKMTRIGTGLKDAMDLKDYVPRMKSKILPLMYDILNDGVANEEWMTLNNIKK